MNKIAKLPTADLKISQLRVTRRESVHGFYETRNLLRGKLANEFVEGSLCGFLRLFKIDIADEETRKNSTFLVCLALSPEFLNICKSILNEIRTEPPEQPGLC